MKNKVLLIIFSLLGLISVFSNSGFCSKIAKDSITVYSSPELMNLSLSWAKEFELANPGTGICVLQGSGNSGNLNIVSSDSDVKEESWKEVVVRDIYVPVINTSNPYLEQINSIGFTKEMLSKILSHSANISWSDLLGISSNIPVEVYLTQSPELVSCLESFLKPGNNLSGQFLPSGSDVVTAVKSNKFSIGFCRLSDIQSEGRQSISGLTLLSIDKNGNGKIDSFEKIYSDINSFNRGVWIGKYPKELYHNILVVAPEKPRSQAEKEFVKWILTSGQQFAEIAGYSNLALNERQSKLEQLNENPLTLSEASADYSWLVKAIVFIAVIIAGGSVLGYINRKRTSVPLKIHSPETAFTPEKVRVLNGLFFDKSHTWAFMEKDGNVKVGIDDFILHVTGEITKIKMKNPGDKVKKGEAMFTIVQNGKQLNFKAPVSGIIRDNNVQLQSNAGLLNCSPLNEGWIYLLEPVNWLKEIQFLSMSEKYLLWINNEFVRLKDFFSAELFPSSASPAFITLQDGGELQDKLLADLGPEVWEEFQMKFLDVQK